MSIKLKNLFLKRPEKSAGRTVYNDGIGYVTTTIGSITIGSAVGSCFSPAGTVIGAVIGGATGAALSVFESRTRKIHK